MASKVGFPDADALSMADGGALLSFINHVRGVQNLSPLRHLALIGADPDDERECILARSMRCPIGDSSDARWRAEGRWVMRFRDHSTARTVAVVTEQDWLPDSLEVELPALLVDFATAAHYGLVEPDEFGFVRSWLVPRDSDNPDAGLVRNWLPEMEPPAVTPAVAA